MQSQAAELKSQGAVEAARDSRSNVTAEDAERKMVEEARRAGGGAYQFNPDATPEEKAAQARSRVPPGFHHEKKHKAVGIVTDIDDGTPDKYDLPPPSKSGALPTSPASTNGHLPGAKGHLSEEENARWEERVGWAPRFGTGSIKDEEIEDGRDHQTWVETRLEDKFFGDWYHNTAVIAFACLSSWFVAVLGGGLAWIFIIMAVCGTYYRTSIRRVRRNFRDDVNREMAKHKLENDVESLEWINSFLVKFWPIFEPVLCETVINSVDQVLSTATPAFLDSLRLKSFILGSKPPRLEHVKTYPKADDDIVLMDWKFSFTPTDTADLTARQIKNKINPKVVLEVRIGKAMVSKGLDVIVEDMAFSGLMRVKFKLQIPFPHVERIDVCFLDRPEIDYVCKPLGGDTFGFDIGFLPGLQSFIMEQIHGNVGPIMYAPNVFPIEVAKMIAGDAVDQAIGVLAVTIHGAHGLKNPDKFSGAPDPYTIVSLNSRDALGKTEIVKESSNPRWNETKFVIITSFKDNLTLQVFDFNDYRKDKELGTATFALDQLENDADFENQQLDVMGNGKARGILQADVRFFPVLEGRTLADGTTEAPPESNSGIAKFTVEQAKDLDGTKSLVGQTNPYGVLLLNGKEVHVTHTSKRTNNPIWDNGSKEVLITDRRDARFGLVIKDERDLGSDAILGTYQIKLDDMLQMMEKGQEWYNLAGAKSGRAKITCHWKPVGLTGSLGGTGGYVTPIGVMRLHFKGAKGLRNVETMGKSDPYVRILVSGIEKGRTVTFQNNLNPEWDEVLYVPMHTSRERLTLEVMDEENLGKDRSLGLVEVPAAEYIAQAENGEYLVHDERKSLADPLRMFGKGAPKGTLNYTVAFYPCLNVVDPEKEEQELKAKEEEEKRAQAIAEDDAKKDSVELANEKKGLAGRVDDDLAKQLEEGEKEHEDEVEELPKVRITSDDLHKYESGLIIFKLIEGELSQSNCQVEVLIDDMRFPSYVSSKAKSKQATFNETGDTFVRELDVSQITLRLMEPSGKKDDDKQDRTIAKLTGDTLGTLKQCLHKPTVLTLRDSEGGINKITVSLKFIPVKMQLDPSESINNSGELRVDVLDAANLPAADRNGYSDPYCRFQLNGKDVFKTKTVKKTLNPAWGENFVVPVPSRIAANFKAVVMDWDMANEDDKLGETDINLELLDPLIAKEYKLTLDGDSGSLRLRLHFKPNYVTRSKQGSSTFSGTFGAPTKIVTGVAGAPIKGVGIVGGGMVKGASFIKQGFRSKKKTEGSTNGTFEREGTPDGEVFDAAKQVPTLTVNGDSPQGTSEPPAHSRSRSFGAQSIKSITGGKAAGPDAGTASFTIISASGYPASAHVRVHVKQISLKGAREVHKSKAMKSNQGLVQWESETFKLSCTPDTQFQVQVKDHATFGSSTDLGEGLLFIDESTAGSEKAVKAGTGTVVLRSSFVPAESSGSFRDSPKSNGGSRRSFLHRKEKD
ncbi:MAG: hypothetical protein M1832_005696 [Thelocarpon impressellum]|nr:MAG: hypothetical protein M1832_005696 [Thelocarpon impressellum]